MELLFNSHFIRCCEDRVINLSEFTRQHFSVDSGQLCGANIFIRIIQSFSFPVSNSLQFWMWLTRELLEYFITINSNSLHFKFWVCVCFVFGVSISVKGTSQLKKRNDVCFGVIMCRNIIDCPVEPDDIYNIA